MMLLDARGINKKKIKSLFCSLFSFFAIITARVIIFFWKAINNKVADKETAS